MQRKGYSGSWEDQVWILCLSQHKLRQGTPHRPQRPRLQPPTGLSVPVCRMRHSCWDPAKAPVVSPKGSEALSAALRPTCGRM